MTTNDFADLKVGSCFDGASFWVHYQSLTAKVTCLVIVVTVDQTYGRELAEANEWCMKYRRTGKEAELTQVVQRCLPWENASDWFFTFSESKLILSSDCDCQGHDYLSFLETFLYIQQLSNLYNSYCKDSSRLPLAYHSSNSWFRVFLMLALIIFFRHGISTIMFLSV